jgi:antitoxin (DNA-binding transcriptional repressor) of toxin-antitoxin stability system
MDRRLTNIYLHHNFAQKMLKITHRFGRRDRLKSYAPDSMQCPGGGRALQINRKLNDGLPTRLVSRRLSDMKTLTMRDLNRKTASVLDAVEQGEAFEVRRNGRAIGYLTQTPPPPERKPDWKAHFQWLRRQPKARSKALLAEFEEERRRLRARDRAMGKLP